MCNCSHGGCGFLSCFLHLGAVLFWGLVVFLFPFTGSGYESLITRKGEPGMDKGNRQTVPEDLCKSRLCWNA